MRKTGAVLASLALALGASACGSDDEEGVATSPASPSETSASGEAPQTTGTQRVGMKNLEFEPAEITVGVGQTVRWVNDESIQHNVVAEDGADFKSELLGQGDTYEQTFDEEGAITYVCTLHPGMDGTVTVTPEGSAG